MIARVFVGIGGDYFRIGEFSGDYAAIVESMTRQLEKEPNGDAEASFLRATLPNGKTEDIPYLYALSVIRRAAKMSAGDVQRLGQS